MPAKDIELLMKFMRTSSSYMNSQVNAALLKHCDVSSQLGFTRISITVTDTQTHKHTHSHTYSHDYTHAYTHAHIIAARQQQRYALTNKHTRTLAFTHALTLARAQTCVHTKLYTQNTLQNYSLLLSYYLFRLCYYYRRIFFST